MTPRAARVNESLSASRTPLYGLILAGGRSRRFGRDKAALEVRGEALLDRTARLLAPHVEKLFVSVRPGQTDDPLRRQYPLIVDRSAGQGPAAGLLAAHALEPGAAWLVLACDLPNLSARALDELCHARDPGGVAVAHAAPDGQPEPLCAIYEPATLTQFAREAERGGSLSPRDFLAASGAKLLPTSRTGLLANINSPGDLKKIIKHE